MSLSSLRHHSTSYMESPEPRELFHLPSPRPHLECSQDICNTLVNASEDMLAGTIHLRTLSAGVMWGDLYYPHMSLAGHMLG